MKYLISFFASILLILSVSTMVRTEDKSANLSESAAIETKTSCGYPIAPGVWYPGDGALPENPVRYYRIRCWPGCHSGSTHGKYPDRPLNMNPIFPTSTIPDQPTVLHKAK
jgi:hypothetical protein